MEIPKFLANAADNGSMLDKLIKTPKLKKKELEEKELLNVIMQFDLDSKCITLDVRAYQPEKSEKEYNYFGNNPAATMQIYAVREPASLFNYWTGRPRGVLYNLYEKLSANSELKELLHGAIDCNLLNDKGINIDFLISAPHSLTIDENKKFKYDGSAMAAEKILMNLLGLSDANKQKIVLVIPSLISAGQQIIISKHADYVNLVAASLQTETGKKSNKINGICHVCGNSSDTINTKSYTSKLSRHSIGKVFETTKVNYSPDFSKTGHQRNYALCKECFEKIFNGEQSIMKKNQMRIAGESAIILFEPIIGELDKQKIKEIKEGIDFVFNSNDVNAWLNSVQRVFDRSNVSLFEFHILFYKSDGKSCKIIKSIESVSWIRFCDVVDAFSATRADFNEQLAYFNLGSIYHLIPVQKNKKDEQINIDRLLDFYGAIIKGQTMQVSDIFALAAEALDRGLKEMRSSEVRNYKNLYRLEKLRNMERLCASNESIGKEYYIQQITLEYLALFEVLQKLSILDKEVFVVDNPSAVRESNIPEYIAQKEAFLANHRFSDEAKGLFYLGVLMYQVGEAQRMQKHTTKPILDKVIYAGMTKKDVIAFYGEIQDKLRQYSGVFKKADESKLFVLERYNCLLHRYWGNFEELRLEHDKANVFYLMSGYASCVPLSNKNRIESKVNQNEGQLENENIVNA